MRVWNYNTSSDRGLVRVFATVTWEDSDRPEREIYFETEARFAEDIRCNPHAFLLAAIMPAMRHGEHRVRVDGKVCPELRSGLITAMKQLRQWYGEDGHQPVAIEATRGFQPPLPRSPQRTAFFMSGGVDSLATLRSNRLDFPPDHPGAIRDGFFVHGLDVGGYESLYDNRENSEQTLVPLSRLAERADVTLIPVYTNLRHLDDDDTFFFTDWFGVALGSIAHAFSNRITSAKIAASESVAELDPMGSHPLLDPNYSSFDLRIEHDGARLCRMDKVGLIAEWDDALQSLRACFDAFRAKDALNCGRCEKCLRTMTELLVHGKLGQCPTYPLDDVTPDMLRTIKGAPSAGSPVSRLELLREGYLTLGPANSCYWRELIPSLRRIGREDLIAVIEERLAEFERFLLKYERYKARLNETDWRGPIKRFDRRYLDGALLRLNRVIKNRRLHL